ncbi:MAG: hypothetical protein QGH45_02545, partial [Myxococcota bacterium]|nr:hypothetical protein [Myxococcota bacterium]
MGRIYVTLLAALAVAGYADGAEFFEGNGFYLGDLHSHTAASGDGNSSDLGGCSGECGAYSDVAGHAAAYDLDFVSYTDHVNGGQTAEPDEWMWTIEAIFDAHDPDDGLVTVPAAELFFDVGGHSVGHKNLYFFADNEDLEDIEIDDTRFNGTITALNDCQSIWDWMKTVEAAWGDVVLLSHHPALGGDMACDWSCHVPTDAAAYSPSAEIYGGHGDSSFADTTFDPLWIPVTEASTLESALDPDNFALRIGFVGGTDRHDTNPGAVCKTDTVMPQHPYGGGLTIAVIDEEEDFDRQPLYQALRDRRTYATSGPLVPAVAEYWADDSYLGGMGESLLFEDADELEIRVRVPEIWDAFVIEVLMVGPDGRAQMTAEGGGNFVSTLEADEVPDYLYPMLILDGEAWYGEDGCDDGGESAEERVWLSPTWFTPEPEGDDDDDDDDDDHTDDDDATADDDDSTGDDDASGDDDDDDDNDNDDGGFKGNVSDG